MAEFYLPVSLGDQALDVVKLRLVRSLGLLTYPKNKFNFLKKRFLKLKVLLVAFGVGGLRFRARAPPVAVLLPVVEISGPVCNSIQFKSNDLIGFNSI